MTEIILPQRPPDVKDAVAQANQLAYGFEKHNDVEYWRALYEKDPGYAWLRLLGWMAGGTDVAHYGLWANPPSEWNWPTAPVPEPAPEPSPTPPDLAGQILNELRAIREGIDRIVRAVEHQ